VLLRKDVIFSLLLAERMPVFMRKLQHLRRFSGEAPLRRKLAEENPKQLQEQT